MNFENYQKKAHRTAKYKDIRYIYFGLYEEVAEMISKINKGLFRGDGVNKHDLEKEIGDVFWFISEISLAQNIKIGKPGTEKISRQQIPDILTEMALQSLFILRSPEKTLTVKVSLTNIWAGLESLIDYFWLKPTVDIWRANIDKLASRQKRNKISGSGDSR